jgi:hypothetical protein
VRADRERCSDELAARWLGSRIRLAQGLASLRLGPPSARAVAINSGDLVGRVERLLSPHRSSRHPGAAALAVTLVAGLVIAVASVAAATPPPVPRNLLHARVARLAPPTLVLGGNDPVRLIAGEATVGRPDIERRAGGYIYRFATEASAAEFDRDPSRYAVVNAVICPVTGTDVEPEIYRVVDGRIYLFCCARSTSIPEPLLLRLTATGPARVDDYSSGTGYPSEAHALPRPGAR